MGGQKPGSFPKEMGLNRPQRTQRAAQRCSQNNGKIDGEVWRARPRALCAGHPEGFTRTSRREDPLCDLKYPQMLAPSSKPKTSHLPPLPSPHSYRFSPFQLLCLLHQKLIRQRSPRFSPFPGGTWQQIPSEPPSKKLKPPCLQAPALAWTGALLVPEPPAQCSCSGLRVQAEVFTGAWMLLTPLIPATWNLCLFLHPMSALPFRAHSPGAPHPLPPSSAFLCWNSVSAGCDLAPRQP